MRYKKRFFMTIFGIGGCMALMLVGFGLKDSCYEIAELQYAEIQFHDGSIYLSRLLRNDRAVVGQRVLFFAPSVMKIYILGDVLRILYIHDIEKQLDDMLRSLNLVIVVLIISAGALAFVVLYNLNTVYIYSMLFRDSTISIRLNLKYITPLIRREKNTVSAISAGALAFVVLYNLNTVNIAERKRELATLKVLGFYDMEAGVIYI